MTVPSRTARRFLVPALAAAFLALLLGGATPARAGRAAPAAVELTQVLGKGDRLSIVLSETGASAIETRAKTRTGVVVRYDDQQVFLLDFAKEAYGTETIGQAVADLKLERKQIAGARAEIPFRTATTRPEFPRAKLTPLDLTAKVADIPAHAYLAQQGDSVFRLWLADDLPSAPPEVQKLVGGALDVPILSAHPLLRDEYQRGDKWIVALDTVKSGPAAVPPDFAPPKGWRAEPLPKRRTPSTVPAAPSRLFGPVSAKPDLFVLYWNGPFSPAFTAPMNGLFSSLVGSPSAPSPYWAPLGQYGVGAGRFIGSSAFTWPLPATVGSWNVFAIETMVGVAMLATPAPKIWWRAFARDPIIAIMVPGGAVAPGGWGGYHLFNVGIAAFLPWPVSMATHLEMPWFIVKAGPLGAAPSPTTTTTASHELVETASDPVPLSANTDYAKSPPWVGGELADICSVGTPAGLVTSVRFGFTLTRFWSSSSGTCVG
jgi:hypothetical protein